MELCGVPPKETIRRVAFRILTQVTAPPPSRLSGGLPKAKKVGGQIAATPEQLLDGMLADAVTFHGLPQPAANNLRRFIVSRCLPLPTDFLEALDCIQDGVVQLRRSGRKDNKPDPRRLKRFDDVGRSLKSMRELYGLLVSAGISPVFGREGKQNDRESRLSCPLYISLDLGLRQRRKHLHGLLHFQAIALPDDYFERNVVDEGIIESNDTIISASGPGSRIAEGGRYDELVRKYRPPGNFGSALFNYYTGSPIPMCVSIRFAVGKMVEVIYKQASLPTRRTQYSEGSSDVEGMEVLRASLGHPLYAYSYLVRCIVSGVHGLDAASAPERFIVASRLWMEGVAAEYLAQSGLLSSLLRQQREQNKGPGTSDWSVDELCGVCAILKVSYCQVFWRVLVQQRQQQRHLRHDLAISDSFRCDRPAPSTQRQEFGSAASNPI